MIVTFAAIVLGLLITSAKNSFDTVETDVRTYSIALLQLDEALRDAGAAALPLRQILSRYTAAAIASTWTSESPPAGNYPHQVTRSSTDLQEESSTLRELLNSINKGIQTLAITTPAERNVQADCIRQMERVFQQRWTLISASQGSLSLPFFIVLVSWLSIIFLCFGLSAPFNPLSIVIIFLGGLALSSALFVFIDLNTLFDNGIFTISSQSMRGALAHMSQP